MPDGPTSTNDAGATCTSDPECAGGAGMACNASGQVVTCTAQPGFPTCFKASGGTACPGIQTCQGAGVCTCPADPVCGTQTSGAVCGPTGGTVSCNADAQGCAVASTEVNCPDNGMGAALVCSAGLCVCPTADIGTVENGHCDNLGMQVCETGGAGGSNNVLVCSTVPISGQNCQLWETFGGVGGMGDCRDAGVTCDPVAHECACPAHTGNVWFANPVNVTDRTLFHTLGLVENGIQSPAACAFETVTTAFQHAVDQVNSHAAAGATVVLAGGTGPLTPALFAQEPWATSFDIPDGIKFTVDTDTTIVGINPPQGVTFDPRNAVLMFNPATQSASAFAVRIHGGSSVHGFTIVGGGCGALQNQNCTPITALQAQDGGSGSRADGMFLEGGGGRDIADATNGPGALTANGDGTVTMTVTISDDDARADAIANAEYVLVNGATVPTGLPASPHDGVFRIVSATAGSGDTVNVTYTTNVAGLTDDTTASWILYGRSAFIAGLDVNGASGVFSNIVAENFWPRVGGSTATGVVVDSTGSGTAEFKGLWSYNNAQGVSVSSGTVQIDADGITTFLATFAHAIDRPIIEHTGVAAGLNVVDGVTTANNLSVFGTQNEFGVTAQGGTLILNGGNIDQNVGGGGLIVDGATFVQATATSFSSNLGIGVEVDDTNEGNATFINSHIDSNTSTGLEQNSGAVFVVGGAAATVNGNQTGVVLNSGDLGISGATTTIASNLREGVLAVNEGNLSIDSANIELNSVNSTDEACDETHPHNRMAVDVGGDVTFTMSASTVQNNGGGGVRVGTTVVDKVKPLGFKPLAPLEAQGTITGSTISGNNTGNQNCDDYDGLEVLSSVELNGTTTTVSGNNGNGIDVHDGAVLQTDDSGVAVSGNGADGLLVEFIGFATLNGTDSVSGNCATPTSARSDQGPLAGIAAFGQLTATGTSVSGNLNACDGIFIDSGDSDVFNVLDGVNVSGNTGNGIRIADSFGNDGNANDTEDPVADSDMGTQIIDGSIVAANTLAGIAVGGGTDQDGDTYVLIADSFVDRNTGGGIVAKGTDDPATFVAIISDEIIGNTGAGLDVTGAHLRAATVGGTLNAGFSKNDIEHNGFTSETQCLSAEATAQIVFHGALIQLSGSTCTGGDVTTCETNNTAGHCIFNSTTNQCFHAYWLQGGTTDTCDQQNTNIISGYAGETATSTTGPAVVGLNALGGAAVNASGNTWKHSSPALTVDISNDAASFVKRVGACQGHNTCKAPTH